MRKNVELTNTQLENYLNQFYSAFETGYEFEEFLKIYFEKLGLDEVSVTKRARDGGIDLTAMRPGIGNFSESDTIHYYIQAKRFSPSSSVSVKQIRELKGVIPVGQKGIFVTTSKFSKDAISESNNNPSNPVVLIDGKSLIESCIDNDLGFIFVPVFKKELIKGMFIQSKTSDNLPLKEIISVDKMVTANDIRARIIRVPNEILKQIQPHNSSINIKLGDAEFKKYKFNQNGRFISGVTSFFNKYNFVDEVGAFYPKKVTWIKDKEGIKILVDNR